MTERIHNGKSPNKGSGDPVQRAAREARIKQSLRDNLQRRKLKGRKLRAKALQASDDDTAPTS